MLVGCGCKDDLSINSTNVLVANLKPLYWALKHRVFTITYVLFGNLSLFGSYAVLMRPKKADTAILGC